MDNFDVIALSSFYGGMSVDAQIGSKAQFYYGKHIDFRKNPTQFTVLPGTRKASGGVVTDLVLDMCQVPSGIRYAVGDTGRVYRVSTAGVWSLFATLSEASGAGILYRPDVDMIYISGQTSVARIKNVSTTPVYEGNFFANGKTTTTTCYKTGGTNTYSVPITTTESANDVRTFISDIEAIHSIKVKIVTKGTGNWTLTMHDDANNVMGTSTVTNANLTSGQLNEFAFSTAVRALVSPNGRTYHFHLTSTVADGTVQTTTASSLADCDMELWADALITTKSTLHPIYQFANMTLIGNERYVTSYEPLQDQPTTSDYTRHRLTFPPGYEAIGFAQLDLYVAIACAKRSASGNFQEGKIFLWDGVQTTYNRYWDVPEGAPESLFSEKNVLAFIANGALYRSSGTQPVKVRTFRNTDTEFSGVSTTTYAPPHGMTVRSGVLLIGYPYSTTNQSLEHGVYSLGHISNQYPESWGYSYTMSSNSTLNNGSNNLRIGMVKNYGDTLYISWRDDSASPQKYGVDVVDNSSTPAPDFDIQLLSYYPSPYKPKAAHKAIACFLPLPTGTQVRFKWKIDGASSWTYGDWLATTNATRCIQDLGMLAFNSIVLGFEGTVTGLTPTPNYIALVLDQRKAEREWTDVGA